MGEEQREKYLSKLGDRIRKLRIERNISQGELARKCGYDSRSTINKIEHGVNDAPQSKIKAIADALGVGICDVICIDCIKDVKPTTGSNANEMDAHAIGLFQRLDTLDKGRAIGGMEEMLKADKYIKKRIIRKDGNVIHVDFGKA